MTVNPVAAIEVLQKSWDDVTDPEQCRAQDDLVAYALMWSPPYFRTAGDVPPDSFVHLMRSLAVDGALALIHANALYGLTPAGQYSRLVAYIPMEIAKPLAKAGATCISSGLGTGKITTLWSYPLAVGALEHWDNQIYYSHPTKGALYDELAARYNDVQDVNDGLAYLERTIAARLYRTSF